MVGAVTARLTPLSYFAMVLVLIAAAACTPTASAAYDGAVVRAALDRAETHLASSQADEGWTGTAYIVEHDGSLAYRITGGMNGAVLDLIGAVGLIETLSRLLVGDYEDGAGCVALLSIHAIETAVDAAFLALAFPASPVLLAIPGGWIVFLIVQLLVMKYMLQLPKEPAEEACFGD